MDLEALKRKALAKRRKAMFPGYPKVEYVGGYSDGFDDAVRELRERINAQIASLEDRENRGNSEGHYERADQITFGIETLRAILGEAPPVVSPTEEPTR